MYRSAAKRLLADSCRSYNRRLPTSHPPVIRNSILFASSSTPANESLNFPNPNLRQSDPAQSGQGTGTTGVDTDTATFTASSSTSSTAAEQEARRSHGQSSGDRRPRTEYKEEQARVLNVALRHVNRLGWTEAAMMAGAREIGVSPSIVGSFPRKEAELVEYFMDDSLQRLIDAIDSQVELNSMIPSERISKLVKLRLEMQAPYISRWPQALSIQALPTNIPTSLKQRAMLVDEIWHAAGDVTMDIDWYVKRAVLGGIYSATEVYMLTDNSRDFRDTWAFLDARVRDAFDLKKTVQEAQYLAEAVGAGVGSSLEGLVKRVSQMIIR
ncbi:hypothetical protein Dimus_025826 [Dionaea muscipula]